MSVDAWSGTGLGAKQELKLAETQKISVCEVLDRVLKKGAVIDGEATISVAGIDLVYLGLKLILTSIETARMNSGYMNPAPGAMNLQQEWNDGLR